MHLGLLERKKDLGVANKAAPAALGSPSFGEGCFPLFPILGRELMYFKHLEQQSLFKALLT